MDEAAIHPFYSKVHPSVPSQLISVGKDNRVRKALFRPDPTLPLLAGRDIASLLRLLSPLLLLTLLSFACHLGAILALRAARRPSADLAALASLEELTLAAIFWSNERTLRLHAVDLGRPPQPPVPAVPGPDGEPSRAAVEAMLAGTAQRLHDEWTTTLFGSAERGLTGIAFDAPGISRVVFGHECLRIGAPCPSEGDPLHAATHGGLDKAMGAVVESARLLAGASGEDVALRDVLFDVVLQVGRVDVMDGLSTLRRMVGDEAHAMVQAAVAAEISILLVATGILGLYILWMRCDPPFCDSCPMLLPPR